MFNPIQSQAALQNKARFPDKRLQQYASGPPQPTGQVTPPMAGEELAQRGAKRQAFQNQAAMQADPSNRPPVLAEKIMQLQQMEQALGIQAAMLAKREQDLAAREQGIAALPMRPDMFTAMDGGIVFSGGGEVQRFAGGGSAANRAYRRALEKRIEDQETARTDLGLINEPYVDPFAGSPSTIKEDKAPNNKKPPSTVGPAGQAAPSAPGIASLAGGTSFKTRMGELDPYLKASVDRSESTKLNAELVKTYEDIKKEIAAGRMTEEEGRRIIENKKAEMTAEYAEYTAGRAERRAKVADALRGQKPELIDYLGAMAEGGPGKTLAETLSRAIPGTTKLRMEQKAREMAAAKFMAEAEELDAKADLAERRGQTKEAEAFRDKAEDRKLKSAQTNISMLQAGQGGIKAALEQARAGETEEGRRLSSAAQAATSVQGSQIAADTQRDLARFNAQNQFALEKYRIDAQAALQAGKEDEFVKRARQIAAITGEDPKAVIQQLLSKGKSSVKTADPAKALEAVRAIPFNDPMLIGRAGLTADEMMKMSRSKTYEELPPIIQKKLNRVREAMYQQMTTGAADASLFE